MVIQKKINYAEKLKSKFSMYEKMFIVNADDVSSQQLQNVRKELRGTAEIVLGKNTMMKFVINKDKAQYPDLLRLFPHLKGNVGFVFTNGDLNAVKDILLAQKVQAPAKADALAPISVTVPKQLTTLGPEKTSFFQALQIPTKITRGTIEIINDVDLIKAGDIVKQSEAQLLQMLKIYPFQYGLKIQQIYENGSCYSPDALEITEDDILNGFMKSTQKVACVSLSLKRPTLASVPHIIANTIKSMIAISVVTDYDLKEAQQVKEYLKDPTKFATAAPVVTTAPVEVKPVEKEAAKPEPSESEDSDIGMGMFD